MLSFFGDSTNPTSESVICVGLLSQSSDHSAAFAKSKYLAVVDCDGCRCVCAGSYDRIKLYASSRGLSDCCYVLFIVLY